MPVSYTDEIVRPDRQFEYTTEQIEELLRCKKDIFYWAEKYVYLQHPTKGAIKLSLTGRDYQRQFLDALANHRQVILLAARQMGKSASVITNILHHCCFDHDLNIAMLANQEARAKTRMRELKFAYKKLPPWMKPGVTKWDETFIIFDNGCKIQVAATHSDSLAGEAISVLFLDEFARVPPNVQEEFWAATYPTISEGGKIIVVSTPRGVGDKFHQIWIGATTGQNGFFPVRADWWQHPERDEAWKRAALSEMGSIMFDREYGLSFLGSVNTLVENSVLATLKAEEPKEILLDNAFRIYTKPLPDHIYVVGVDVALGIQENYSIGQVFDITGEPYIQAAVYRSNTIDPNRFSRLLAGKTNPNTQELEVNGIIQLYNNAYIIVEINAMGEEVKNYLWYDISYENIFHDSVGGTYGVKSTQSSKLKSLTFLKNDMDGGKFVLYDKDTISELTKYISLTRDKFGIRGGGNDDTVRALAWVSYFLRSDYWSYEKEMNELERKRKKEELEFRKRYGQVAKEEEAYDPFNTLQAFLNTRQKEEAEFRRWLEKD